MAKFVDNFYHKNAPKPGPGAVGGLWELHGDLQKNYLIGQGLNPEHKLLDIGCGVFRLGVKIILFSRTSTIKNSYINIINTTHIMIISHQMFLCQLTCTVR